MLEIVPPGVISASCDANAHLVRAIVTRCRQSVLADRCGEISMSDYASISIIVHKSISYDLYGLLLLFMVCFIFKKVKYRSKLVRYGRWKWPGGKRTIYRQEFQTIYHIYEENYMYGI